MGGFVEANWALKLDYTNLSTTMAPENRVCTIRSPPLRVGADWALGPDYSNLSTTMTLEDRVCIIGVLLLRVGADLAIAVDNAPFSTPMTPKDRAITVESLPLRICYLCSPPLHPCISSVCFLLSHLVFIDGCVTGCVPVGISLIQDSFSHNSMLLVMSMPNIACLTEV